MINRCGRIIFLLVLLVAPFRVAFAQTLELLVPNGGEVFSEGDVIPIVWTGIANVRSVTLEYTTDNGQSWQMIVKSATGGRYLWAVPSIKGASCKVRATTAEDDYTLVRTLNTPAAANGALFSPDGTMLAGITQTPGKILVWSVETGELITTVAAHDSSIIRADFSPDGTKFATCALDGSVKIWNTTSWEMIRKLVSDPGTPCFGVRFSPNGKEIAAGYIGGAIRVWNIDSGKTRLDFTPNVTDIRAIDYSRDGKHLLSGSSDRTARVWSAVDGSLELTLAGPNGHSGFVNSVRFSPDGSTIATGGFDNVAKLWNGETGAFIRNLSGHGGYVYAVKFDPSGERLLTTSADMMAKVWRVSDGKPLDTLRGHTGPISRGMFGPDGRLIATASTDKTVKIWQSLVSVVSDSPFQITSCQAGVAHDGDSKRPGKTVRPDLK